MKVIIIIKFRRRGTQGDRTMKQDFRLLLSRREVFNVDGVGDLADALVIDELPLSGTGPGQRRGHRGMIRPGLPDSSVSLLGRPCSAENGAMPAHLAD